MLVENKILKIGATELTEEDVATFREVFDLVDVDKGGSIDGTEVKQLLHLLGIQASPEQVSAMIAEIDKDENGCVDFQEFLQVMAGAQRPMYSKRELMRAFRLFSDQGSPKGCIHPRTLVTNLLNYCGEGVTEEDVERLVGQMPRNSQGMILYQDTIDVFLSGGDN